MSRRWPKSYAPYSTCDICGWAGHDWSFKYQGLCSKCYKQWQKEKREALKRLKLPNDNLEIANGIVVTRNIQNRLFKQAQLEIPPVKRNELAGWLGIIGGWLLIVTMWVLFFNDDFHPEYRTLMIGIMILAIVLIFVTVRISRRETKEGTERYKIVVARVEELARERKALIEEAELFYSSAEWRLLRQRVIKQQGRICQECRLTIKNDFDLTVDHIKPRSVCPEEALKLSNLRVLCRRCNAKKGDAISESDTN